MNNPTQIRLQPERLENETVVLLPLHENDFERLYQAASDPDIWEQHPVRNRYQREVFRIYFEGAVSGKSAFLIFDAATNELIGSTRFYDYNPNQSVIALGYTFLIKKYWGGKHNLATKKLLLDHAFHFVETVLFHIGADNVRSQKAILKLGATKTGEMDVPSNGESMVHYEYAITRQAWSANGYLGS